MGRFKAVGWLAAIAVSGLMLGGLPSATAQDDLGSPFGEGFQPNFPDGFDGADKGEPLELEASYEVAERGGAGRVHVEATLQPNWHIYSVTQPAGGPRRTELKLADGSGVELSGAFAPDKDPQRSQDEIWEGVTIEEHAGRVRWTAPFEVPAGADPKSLNFKVAAVGQICETDGPCIPFDKTLTTKYAGTFAETTAAGRFREGDYAVEWSGSLQPAEAKPGDTVKLELTATPDAGYHVYRAAVDDADFSTNFALTRRGVLQPSLPIPDEEPVTIKNAGGEVTYHEGEVTWTIEFAVPKDASQGAYPIEGLVAYQACTDSSCLLPKAVKFAARLSVGDQTGSAAAPLELSAAKRAAVLDAVIQTPWESEAASKSASAPVVYGSAGDQSYSLLMMLFAGIGAGLILNLMPCVLPVLGLKLMSLTDQAGQDRRGVLLSNIWYSLGVMTVFWLLATLVALFSFAWGEQFTYVGFKLPLTLLIFALALSFLGVWEIPVPGFASGKMSQELQHHEGATGAYFKGLFTTIIATPCGGPLLGLVLGLLIDEPAPVIFAVFTAMGLGMALPFLLIGLVPKLVAWLPQPGEWMETLKQLMAFVLLGTVAFFFSTFSADYQLPVFVSLIGVWFGCWLIGKVPNWEAWPKRASSWLGGLASMAVVTWLALRMLVPGETVVPWQPYDEMRLTELRREGKTVMIDFTASWCLTCKYNYKVAINTEPTAEMVDELEVVPMLADWSDYNDEIKQKLLELRSQSIPLLAIYPGSNPEQPIILRDVVTQDQVLGALKQAGPSLDQAQTGPTSTVASVP